MQQGRRTASLKASYEAIHTGVPVHEFGIGREIAGAAHSALQALHQDTSRKHKKKWSSSNSSSSSTSVSVPTSIPAPVATPVATPSPTPETPPQTTTDSGDADWTYDPNEPRYCICNQVSYGDMVACDNEDVSIIYVFKLNMITLLIF